MLKRFWRSPSFAWQLCGHLLVAVLGYADYLIGGCSILPFYLIPVLLVAWFVGCIGASLVSLSAGLARLLSECYGYYDSPLRYWNPLQDTIFLLLVGSVVALIRRLLRDEPSPAVTGRRRPSPDR